jgi:hypothetical protein
VRKGLLWAGLVVAGRQFVAVIIVVLSVMWLQPSLLSDAGIISAPAPEVETNQKKLRKKPHALLGLTVALADLQRRMARSRCRRGTSNHDGQGERGLRRYPDRQ